MWCLLESSQHIEWQKQIFVKEKFIEFAACQQIVDEHRLEVEIVRGPDEKRGCNIRNKIEDGQTRWKGGYNIWQELIENIYPFQRYIPTANSALYGDLHVV